MPSKPRDTQSSEELLRDFGNTTADRLRAVTKQYEKRLAAHTMAEQPLEQLIDQVVKTQNEYIAELEARIKELEAEHGGQVHR